MRRHPCHGGDGALSCFCLGNDENSTAEGKSHKWPPQGVSSLLRLRYLRLELQTAELGRQGRVPAICSTTGPLWRNLSNEPLQLWLQRWIWCGPMGQSRSRSVASVATHPLANRRASSRQGARAHSTVCRPSQLRWTSKILTVHTDEPPPVEPPSATLLAEQTEPMYLVVPWPVRRRVMRRCKQLVAMFDGRGDDCKSGPDRACSLVVEGMDGWQRHKVAWAAQA